MIFLGSGDDSWEGRGDVNFLGFILSSSWLVEMVKKGGGEKIFCLSFCREFSGGVVFGFD